MQTYSWLTIPEQRGKKMSKHEDYLALEISGKKLDGLISNLRDRLLNEFWATVPDGPERLKIKERLEKSILAAFDRKT